MTQSGHRIGCQFALQQTTTRLLGEATQRQQAQALVGKVREKINPADHVALRFRIFLFSKISMSNAFKAIAAEPRRRILNHLAGGPMTVGEIAAKFEMATPSISKHLSVPQGSRPGPRAKARPVRDLQHRRGQFDQRRSLPGFLSQFCPQAQKIAAAARQRERKAK